MAPGMVGHYRLETTLGAGGMGVVYRAFDTRLHRPVAVKAIHDRLLTDADAIGRLRREALAAASLDHPYVCRVYELIEAGSDVYIVMEFVEGETLAQRLSRGPLPLAEALRLATEIAEGLANAHARGLVHRDVKPANIMLTRHDHVKLLDFGLARPDVAARSDATTQQVAEGHSLGAGTPKYMAPEQAAGHPVTARADVFALGLVLFECLNGALPPIGEVTREYGRDFGDDTAARVAVLGRDLPMGVLRLIQQCLAPDPTDRPASAAAVAIALRGLAPTETSPGGLLAAGVAGLRRSHPIAAALVLLAVVGGAVWVATRPAPAAEAPPHLSALITDASVEKGSRLSPDGRYVSFLSDRSGRDELYVRGLEGGEPSAVKTSPGVLNHVWSPDARELAYLVRVDATVFLQLVPAPLGGPPRISLPLPAARLSLLRWATTGIFLQADFPDRVALLHIEPREAASATDRTAALAVEGTLRSLDVSADGRRVVYTASIDGQADLWTVNLDGSSRSRLTNDKPFERTPTWAGDQRVVFQSNRGGQIDLWQVAAAGGAPSILASGPPLEEPESATADGTLVTYQHSTVEAHLVLIDPARDVISDLTADALGDFAPHVTPDGTQVLFQRTRGSALEGNPLLDSQVFAASLSTAPALRAGPVSEGLAPRVSPDGLHVAFLQSRPERPLATLNITNLQTRRTWQVTDRVGFPTMTLWPAPVDWGEHKIVWSPDGTELFFVADQRVHRYRLKDTALSALTSAVPDRVIRDVNVASNGRAIAFIAADVQQSSLLVLDTSADGGQVTTVATFGRGPDGRLREVFLKGWAKDDASLVLVRRERGANADFSRVIDVLVATPGAEVRTVGRIDRAFPSTARLDAARGVLYLTRSEDSVHNIYGFSLASGGLHPVTSNSLPGLTFSGIVPLANGKLIGVRDHRRQDIYLIRSASRGGS